MEFNLEIEGGIYNFELDEYGQVWFIEPNEFLEFLKTGFNHETTQNVDVAMEIGRQILIGKGIIVE